MSTKGEGRTLTFQHPFTSALAPNCQGRADHSEIILRSFCTILRGKGSELEVKVRVCEHINCENLFTSHLRLRFGTIIVASTMIAGR